METSFWRFPFLFFLFLIYSLDNSGIKIVQVQIDLWVFQPCCRVLLHLGKFLARGVLVIQIFPLVR